MGMRGAHKLLLSKRKKANYLSDFPSLDRIIAQLVARLSAHSAQWAKTTFRLTETEQKCKRGVQGLWLVKAKHGHMTDISNFCYKL